ncbi:unnamed protein product [Gulo gulo]|uniref:Uncharacterized protein n=1 Tax=Gulo gulo TaxID=48420 RepID=A0A9X9LDT0_GULGU|nr:unnamed protein product [Gulo gulo]
MNPTASINGSFLLSPATSPQGTPLTGMFLPLKPTLPSSRASLKASWCISMDFTSVVTLTGAKVTRFKNTTLPSGTLLILPNV